MGHFIHDVTGDVGDGCEGQAFEVLEEIVIRQLGRVDGAIVNMRVQGADENKETQEQQREDQLLNTHTHTPTRNLLLIYLMNEA